VSSKKEILLLKKQWILYCLKARAGLLKKERILYAFYLWQQLVRLPVFKVAGKPIVLSALT
jgi:hypothetical protein